MKRKSGPKPKNIAGVKFSRLIAMEYIGECRWRCLCDCGNSKICHGADLRRGKIQSCGCLSIEVKKSGVCRRKHGMSSSPEYKSWVSMIRRCADENAIGYHRYGGRGISVCKQWLWSFETFYKDMGPRPNGTTLDRREVNGNYEPGNCRWATRLEQAANTSVSVLISSGGQTMPMEAWARKLGVSSKAIAYRLNLGWSHEKVVKIPFRKHVTW